MTITIPLIPVYFSPEFNAVQTAFDSTRKHDLVYAALLERQLPLEFRAPVPVTQAMLEGVHSPAYVQAVVSGEPRALAASSGLGWCERSFRATSLTSGAMLQAAEAALTRGVAAALVSGFHHAEYGGGQGFCTFNGLVLAAKTLHARGLVQRVAILDLDHHYGNGQESLIRRQKLGFLRNYGVEGARDHHEYHARLNAHLRAIRAWNPDLILFQAGMDPHEEDALGGVDGMTSDRMSERDRLVFEFCDGNRIPVCWNLAGGYSQNQPYSAFPDWKGRKTVLPRPNPVVALHVETVIRACAVFANARRITQEQRALASA